jgi:hypothetical protein
MDTRRTWVGSTKGLGVVSGTVSKTEALDEASFARVGFCGEDGGIDCCLFRVATNWTPSAESDVAEDGEGGRRATGCMGCADSIADSRC